MATAHPPLTLIVAATAKNGIGKAGGLPWPMLKKEMAYFARVTKRVPQSFSDAKEVTQNVVIMGRKTWDSIPAKLRPLKERTNIVITRKPDSLDISHPDVIVASSIESGIGKLQQGQASKAPGRLYIIGGATIYDAAFKLPNRKHVLLTRVHKQYDCDTFFPVDLESDADWTKATSARLSEFVEEAVDDADMEETVNGEVVEYKFQLYEQN
ncbi:hypothetical protein K461DRAFT_102638 [Myriangium duriaei CBS 260.36]|uniref:Dihydrofolate reductase n=1 Tax=Myriangium duriaei CBS 260.36 TaxID=1168546 RepID=A0A9P4J9C0_9PEZI|nr:hypothetical protein K461DRAFT_102638 [Myriangium duriaei CBS 260.36]